MYYFIHRIGNIHKIEEANVERQIFREVGAYKDAATVRRIARFLFLLFYLSKISIAGTVFIIPSLVVQRYVPICLKHFTIYSLQLQTVIICHGFISFRFQSLLQFSPIGCGIYTICQYCTYIILVFTCYRMAISRIQAQYCLKRYRHHNRLRLSNLDSPETLKS